MIVIVTMTEDMTQKESGWWRYYDSNYFMILIP